VKELFNHLQLWWLVKTAKFSLNLILFKYKREGQKIARIGLDQGWLSVIIFNLEPLLSNFYFKLIFKSHEKYFIHKIQFL